MISWLTYDDNRVLAASCHGGVLAHESCKNQRSQMFETCYGLLRELTMIADATVLARSSSYEFPNQLGVPFNRRWRFLQQLTEFGPFRPPPDDPNERRFVDVRVGTLCRKAEEQLESIRGDVWMRRTPSQLTSAHWSRLWDFITRMSVLSFAWYADDALDNGLNLLDGAIASTQALSKRLIRGLRVTDCQFGPALIARIRHSNGRSAVPLVDARIN